MTATRTQRSYENIAAITAELLTRVLAEYETHHGRIDISDDSKPYIWHRFNGWFGFLAFCATAASAFDAAEMERDARGEASDDEWLDRVEEYAAGVKLPTAKL